MAITIPILSEFNDKGIRAAESAFGKIGNVAKKAAIAVGAFAGAGAVVGAKLIGAAENAATANARIEQVAESMGLFGEGTENAATSVDDLTKRLTDLANKTALQTGIDQNQIKLTQAKLLTFKELATTADEVGGSFDRATQVAIDLAAAGFGAAESNAVQLGKALNDPVKGLTALTRSGITFTKQEEELIKTLVASGKQLEAQDMILEAIEKQVGGTAAATANGSDRMRVAFSQLQERLGTALLPMFEKLTNFVLDKLIPGIEGFVALFRSEGIGGIGRVVGEQIPIVIDKLKDIGAALIKWVKDSLPGWLKKLEELGEALVSWIGPRIGPALQKLGEWLGDLANWIINTGLPLLVEKLIQLGNALVEWIGPQIVPALKALGEWLAKLLNWIVTDAFPKLAAQALKLAGALLSWLAEIIPQALAGLATFVLELIKELPRIFADLVSAMLDKGLELGSSLLEGIVDFVKNLPGMLWDAFQATFTKLVELGKEMVKKIVDGIKSTPAAIGDAIRGQVGSVVTDPTRGTVGSLLGIDIWPFAQGGIVTGPTLGLIGEAGPEAVIPLDQMSSMGGSITVNVSGSVISEGDLIETVRRGLVNAQRNGAQLVYSNV
jgi:hypothetical protein